MSPEEFEAFFRRQYPSLVRHLALQRFGRDVAADAAQNAMLKLLLATRPIECPEAWIRLVAKHEALDMVDRAGRERTVARRSAQVGEHHPSTTPQDALAEGGLVLDQLRKLPPRQREVMAWHLDGFTPSEIAENLGISRATVDSNLRHARERLRALWNEEKDGGEAA